jgi:hypothetical protein
MNTKPTNPVYPSNIYDDFVYRDDELDLQFYHSSDIDFSQFSNWSKNRPPDQVRIQQIKQHFLNNNTRLIPGIISAWDKEDGTFYIYDGIHRFLALKEILEQNPDQEFFILIQFKLTKREQEIIDDFINLNKSVSVPTIYIEDTDILKKTVCQNIAEELCKRFPTFVSPSRKPYIYNFNRDNLIEFISNWQINFSKPGVQQIAFQELLKLNQEAKVYVNEMNIAHPKKCKYHDFYLFYLDPVKIQRRMETVLR